MEKKLSCNQANKNLKPMDTKSNFRRGSVELLILHLLSEKDYYGYELSQNITKRSGNVLNIPVGSLYPALYKLIDVGYISDYKKQVGKRLVRVYYHINPEGIERLNLLLEDYYATNKGIQNVLNYSGEQPEQEENAHDKWTKDDRKNV